MIRSRRAPEPSRRCAARTSRTKSYQSRSCQSTTGYGSALTCVYAATGKKPGRAKRGFPVVTASHRSAIVLRNAAESVRGKALVCGSAPAPGATGTADGDALGVTADVALALGDADFAEGDPVPPVLAFAADGGGPDEPLHPASRAAAPSQTVATSGASRDNLNVATPPRIRPEVRVQPRLLQRPVGNVSGARQYGEHGTTVPANRQAPDRRRPARRVLAGHAGVVRRGVRGADAGPGGRVAGHRQGRGHAGRRADWFGQDAGRVLVGDRQAGRGAATRRSEAAHPGALRLAAQGAGRGHRAEPARSTDRDRARRAPARPGRAGHH